MTDIVIWENSLISWLRAFISFVGLYLFLVIILKLAKSRLKVILKKNYKLPISYISPFLEHTKNFFLLILSLYIVSNWVFLSEKPSMYLKTIFIIAFWIQVGRIKEK